MNDLEQRLDKTQVDLGKMIVLLGEIKDFVSDAVNQMEEDILQVSEKGCRFVGKKLIHADSCMCGDYNED